MSTIVDDGPLTRGIEILDDAYNDLVSDNVFDGMSSMVARLWSYRSSIAKSVWRRFCVDVFPTHSAKELIHQAPFSRRAFEKPHGYPGDASTLDFIYEYRTLGEQTSLLGNEIYQWEFQSQGCFSVRARREMLAALIDRIAVERRTPQVLSIACGHARELSNSRAIIEGDIGSFTAFDQDALSLATLRTDYPEAPVIALQGSIRAILSGRVTFTPMDLVYSAGLYDYLPDSTAARLTAKLFNTLRPGGKLVIVNFTPDLCDAGYMEAVMQWWLIYRAERHMQEMVSCIPHGEMTDLRTFRAANGNLVFLEVVRS